MSEPTAVIEHNAMSHRDLVRTTLAACPLGLTAREIAGSTGLAVTAVISVLSKMFSYGEATRQGAGGQRVYVMTVKTAPQR